MSKFLQLRIMTTANEIMDQKKYFDMRLVNNKLVYNNYIRFSSFRYK